MPASSLRRPGATGNHAGEQQHRMSRTHGFALRRRRPGGFALVPALPPTLSIAKRVESRRIVCSELCIGKFSKQSRRLAGGMWQTRHTAARCERAAAGDGTKHSAPRLGPRVFGVGGATQHCFRILHRRAAIRAAAKAPQRKRPCRPRAPSVDAGPCRRCCAQPILRGIDHARPVGGEIIARGFDSINGASRMG